MTRNEKLQKWKSIIIQYYDSGMTQVRFCKIENIDYASFKYWYKKRGLMNLEPGELSDWIEVAENQVSACQDEVTKEGNSIKIKLGYAEITVNPGFDQNLLRDVILALRDI